MLKKVLAISIAFIFAFMQLPVSASQITPDFYVSEAIEHPKPEGKLPEIEKVQVEQLEAPGASASPEDFDAPRYFGRDELLKLEDGEKLVSAYDRLVAGIENFDKEITLYDSPDMSLTANELMLIFDVVRFDHPEQFWYDVNSYSYTVDGKIFEPTYTITTKSELNRAVSRFENAAKDIFEACGITKGMSEYEISLAIHDTLAEHITYDQTQIADDIHTAYGALVNKLAVCDGYARAYQLLLRMAGIQSYIISGNSINPTTQKPEGHAWNLVRIKDELLNDKYYYTDLTWDDKQDNVFYAYFNVDDSTINADHFADPSIIDYPVCDSTDANYFENNLGKLSLEDDSELILQLFELGRQRGENFARIKLTDGTANDFANWLTENGNERLFEILYKLEIFGQVKSATMSVGNELHFWLYNELPEADISTHLEPPHANTLLYPVTKKHFDCNGDFEITKIKWKELKNNQWHDIDGWFNFHTIYGIELTLKGNENQYFTSTTKLTVNEQNDHIVKKTAIPSNEYVIIYTFDPTEDKPSATMEYNQSSGKIEITTATTGSYTVVLADYEDNMLMSVKHVQMQFTAEEAKTINLNELFPDADKVMLLDGESKLQPLCGVLAIN